ncbi:MAG: riboflavin kinase [Brevinema sp.]
MIHLNTLPKASKLHIALGAFDGVHKAHVSIIERAIAGAKKEGGKSVILSFEPLPKEYFRRNMGAGRLLPAAIKEEILKNLGADVLLTLPFSDFCRFSEKEFINRILTKTSEIHFYAGGDFRMGKIDGEHYEGEGLFIHHQDEVRINNQPCRSTTVRNLIHNGFVEDATQFLGREYIYYSRTVAGNRLGRTIDFPTINLKPTDQALPQSGVYFGELIIHEKTFAAAIYVGTRPTLNGSSIRIEAHSIDLFPETQTPQGTPTAVRFIKKISEEKSFESIEKLQEILYTYKNVSLALAAERYKR